LTAPTSRFAVGDARSVDDLGEALRGQDAVISTLGSGLNARQKLIESSTVALLEAMSSAHVNRLVMLSTFAASPTYRATGIMKLARIAMQGIVTDKTVGETLRPPSTGRSSIPAASLTSLEVVTTTLSKER
jgi:NAD(P)H-binding